MVPPIEYIDGHRVHRPLFKVLLNPMLRKIQFWTDKPLVFVSKFEDNKFLYYSMERVSLLK